ncbi:MAG: hypothetical protein Q8N76_06325, partial [Candidatus Omnitrophota bacterium]|nr:hypothetical protein [Candidatus Omnitrophota bacterium]
MSQVFKNPHKSDNNWLIIFSLALTARLALNFLFFFRFGIHAAAEKEIWYYYGIANNTFHISRLDPTFWVFQLIKLAPAEFWFYGVTLAGVLLSSLTAVLIYFLGAKLFNDRRAGFFAGAIYAFLPGPLGMSTANFTHDLVQLPIIALIFLLTLSMADSNGLKKIIRAIFFIILTYLGIQIGPLIIIAVFVSVFYLLIKAVKEDKKTIVFYFIILLALFIKTVFLNDILKILSSMDSQMHSGNLLALIKANSRDLMPIDFQGLVYRMGTWSILAVIGLVFSLRKPEFLSLMVFFLGVIFAFGISRVVRIADMGCALMAAYAFNYIWLKKKALVVIFICGIFSMLFCYNNLKPACTEAEYQSFLWLKNHSQKWDKVLVAWEDGYVLEAISKLEPSSTPRNIDFPLHQIYWKTIDEAYQVLKDNHISFVEISSSYFGVSYIDAFTDRFDYGGNGSIVYRPEQMGITKFSQLKDTFLFKLMDDPEASQNFKLVFEVRDNFTPTQVRIYRV